MNCQVNCSERDYLEALKFNAIMSAILGIMHSTYIAVIIYRIVSTDQTFTMDIIILLSVVGAIVIITLGFSLYSLVTWRKTYYNIIMDNL